MAAARMTYFYKNPYTLESNWQEERTGLPPAPGGIPDLGYRLYTSAHAADFAAPPPGAELTYPRHRPRFGLLTKDTWNEASYSFGGAPGALRDAARGARKFDMTHGGRDMTKAEIAAQFQTTARDAAEGGVGVAAGAAAAGAATAAALARSNYALGAGGAPFLVATDKGKKITGVSGEIVRESADARWDSAAQRSWTGKPDLGLSVGTGKVVREGARARAPARRAPLASARA